MSNSDESFELERAVGFYVNRAAYLMSEEVAKRFLASGYKISAQDFGILFRLWKQDGLSQVQIASLMMRDKTTITRRLDGLVKKALIERRNDENDRRLFRIHLTDLGRQAIEMLMKVAGKFQKEVLEDVPDEEKAITIKTLKQISEKIINK